MSDERRKFKRFDTYMSVKVRDEKGKEFRSESLSNDLSRDGINLSSGNNLKPGAQVDLQINIPDEPKPVYTTGEVMWVKKKGSKDYSLGIKFLLIDPVDKFRVLDYAYNGWLESKVNGFKESDVDTDIDG